MIKVIVSSKFSQQILSKLISNKDVHFQSRKLHGIPKVWICWKKIDFYNLYNNNLKKYLELILIKNLQV